MEVLLGMFRRLFAHLRDETNRSVLAFVGGGIAVVASAAWAIFVYLHPADGPRNAKIAETVETAVRPVQAAQWVPRSSFDKCFSTEENTYFSGVVLRYLAKRLERTPHIVGWSGGTEESAKGYRITEVAQGPRYLSIYYDHDNGVLQVAPYGEFAQGTVPISRLRGYWLQSTGEGCVDFNADLIGTWTLEGKPGRERTIFIRAAQP